MAFLRTYLGPALAPARFQPQPYDHVLHDQQRRENAFADACRYVLANPLRAGLVKIAQQWSFHGAVVPGYPTLQPLQTDFWAKFTAKKSPRCRNDQAPIIQFCRRRREETPMKPIE